VHDQPALVVETGDEVLAPPIEPANRATGKPAPQEGWRGEEEVALPRRRDAPNRAADQPESFGASRSER
jgi:hypothetical protein